MTGTHITASDIAFTCWLAELEPSQVLHEYGTGLSRAEIALLGSIT